MGLVGRTGRDEAGQRHRDVSRHKERVVWHLFVSFSWERNRRLSGLSRLSISESCHSQSSTSVRLEPRVYSTKLACHVGASVNIAFHWQNLGWPLPQGSYKFGKIAMDFKASLSKGCHSTTSDADKMSCTSGLLDHGPP